jgi:aryl-alcohol dehydrogenase-like predicted oxidoreductase
VDLYQIHRLDPETPIEETLEALHDVVKSRQGALYRRVVNVGVAIHAGPRAAECEHGWTRFISMQNHLEPTLS